MCSGTILLTRLWIFLRLCSFILSFTHSLNLVHDDNGGIVGVGPFGEILDPPLITEIFFTDPLLTHDRPDF